MEPRELHIDHEVDEGDDGYEELDLPPVLAQVAQQSVLEQLEHRVSDQEHGDDVMDQVQAVEIFRGGFVVEGNQHDDVDQQHEDDELVVVLVVHQILGLQPYERGRGVTVVSLFFQNDLGEVDEEHLVLCEIRVQELHPIGLEVDEQHSREESQKEETAHEHKQSEEDVRGPLVREGFRPLSN